MSMVVVLWLAVGGVGFGAMRAKRSVVLEYPRRRFVEDDARTQTLVI
jgi:hypothetical protein